MKKCLGTAMLGLWLLAAFAAAGTGAVAPESAFAGDDWQKDFEDTCSKTQDAMTLSVDELKASIEKCDRIKAEVEKLEGAQKKVYLKRVQMCRDLFKFALESKESK